MTARNRTEVVEAEAAVGRAGAEITALVSSAEELTIETVEQLGASSLLLTDIKGRQKSLTALKLSITQPLDEAKRRVLAVFQPAVDRLVSAERTLKGAVLSYAREQERLRREEQARLDEAAERERARLERLAEKQREEDHEDRAAVSEQRAEEVTAPTVAPAVAPAGAVHVRTTWRAEVTDLLALVKACAAGKQPIDLLRPDTVRLNELARSQKGDMSVPGVEAVSEQGVAARA